MFLFDELRRLLASEYIVIVVILFLIHVHVLVPPSSILLSLSFSFSLFSLSLSLLLPLSHWLFWFALRSHYSPINFLSSFLLHRLPVSFSCPSISCYFSTFLYLPVLFSYPTISLSSVAHYLSRNLINLHPQTSFLWWSSRVMLCTKFKDLQSVPPKGSNCWVTTWIIEIRHQIRDLLITVFFMQVIALTRMNDVTINRCEKCHCDWKTWQHARLGRFTWDQSKPRKRVFVHTRGGYEPSLLYSSLSLPWYIYIYTLILALLSHHNNKTEQAISAYKYEAGKYTYWCTYPLIWTPLTLWSLLHTLCSALLGGEGAPVYNTHAHHHIIPPPHDT